MAEGLTISLGPWDETGLMALWSAEQPYLDGGLAPRLAAVVLGGVLPPSHVQAIAYPWLLGADIIVKRPSRDPWFVDHLAAALGPGITLVDRMGLGGALGRVDAVVAVGSDASVREVLSNVPVSTPALSFGHQTAIAVVPGPAARSEPVAASVVRDLATFDQLGCLSPREVFVVGNLTDARHLAGNVAMGLARAPRRLALDVACEGALRGARESALLRGHEVLGPDDLQWGLTVVEGGEWCGTPGGRHAIVRVVPTFEALIDALSPIRGHLSAVSVAGTDLAPGTREALVRLGASRVVRSGQLQAAPPTWPHDGRRPLASLCRWFGRD